MSVTSLSGDTYNILYAPYTALSSAIQALKIGIESDSEKRQELPITSKKDEESLFKIKFINVPYTPLNLIMAQ